jgi:adenosine kinase
MDSHSSSKRILFGVGNPLLDVQAECGEEMLTKYDLKAGNAILAEEKHKPLFEELWKMENLKTIPGGSCLNTIRCSNVSHPSITKLVHA